MAALHFPKKMKHGDLAFNQVYFVVHFVLQPVEAVSSLLDIPAHFYGYAKIIKNFAVIFFSNE